MSIDWDAMVLTPLNSVFGEEITYIPSSTRTAVTVSGVFDEGYTQIDSIGEGVGASTVSPVLGVRAADFTATPRQRDELVRVKTGRRYVVKDVQPDSHGHIKLLLNAKGQ